LILQDDYLKVTFSNCLTGDGLEPGSLLAELFEASLSSWLSAFWAS